MTTEEQTLAQELSAVVVWLTLRPTDWCVWYYGTGANGRPYLDIAVDADAATVAAILDDWHDEGFALRLDERAQVAAADGHRLRVRLHHGRTFRALARSGAVRRPIFGQLLPVAQVAAAEAA